MSPAFLAASIAFLAFITSAFSPMSSTHLKSQSKSVQTFGALVPSTVKPNRAMMSKIDFDENIFEAKSYVADVEKKVLESKVNDKLQKYDNSKYSNKNSKQTNMQVATALAFALAFLPVMDANAAASGGRMGGSFSSPRTTISRPAPMRSSYTSSRTYVTRPSVTIAPTIAPRIGYGSYGYYSTPYFSPYAGGVLSVSRGPSFFDLLFLGGFMFAVSQIFRQKTATAEDTWMSTSVDSLKDWKTVGQSALGPGTSVVHLSVALEVPNRDDRNSILSVLNLLSRTAKTDSRVGIQNLSSEVALEILRRRSSIVSASSSFKHFQYRDKALREFQNRSVKERSKFETETVSKYGGVDYSSSSTSLLPSGSSDRATMAVITLVLAIDGDSTKLNTIHSISDVEQALQRIASDSKVDDCLQSAEILWTPEERTETLRVRDVIADYPELRSV